MVLMRHGVVAVPWRRSGGVDPVARGITVWASRGVGPVAWVSWCGWIMVRVDHGERPRRVAGRYEAWLERGPVKITVAMEGYRPVIASARVGGGDTVVKDFMLS